MVTVQSTVDTGHEDMIHDAQMDFYGTRLATCSSDRAVRIFDVKDGTQILAADLRGHEGPVWQVSWAHPRYGNILASCSYDRRVLIWQEGERGQWSRIYEYSNHDSSVNSVQWAPPELGLVLAAGSSDGSVSVLTYTGQGRGEGGLGWEAEKINNAHTIGCNSVSWAPGSAGGSMRLVTGGCDSLVKVWSKAVGGQEGGLGQGSWQEEAKLEGHSDWVRDTAWAPSLGVERQVVASCGQDRRVIIWTLREGGSWVPKVLHTFEDVVWHVSWSVSGNILAVSGGDNKVSLWKENLDESWQCISDVNKGASAPSG